MGKRPSSQSATVPSRRGPRARVVPPVQVHRAQAIAGPDALLQPIERLGEAQGLLAEGDRLSEAPDLPEAQDEPAPGAHRREQGARPHAPLSRASPERVHRRCESLDAMAVSTEREVLAAERDARPHLERGIAG